MKDSNLSALIVALGTNDRRSHTLVVDDLVRIGRSAVFPLIDVLHDPNPNVRSGAARALGKIGDLSALMPLIDCLRQDANVEVRKSVVWALHMGGAQAVPALIESLNDEDEWVRFGAIIVLAKIGQPAVQSLIYTLQDPDSMLRANAAETLGRISDASAADALAQALEDPDDSVWEQAAISLGRLKDARAVYALMQMVENQHSSLRTKAIKALGQIGDIRAIDCLIDVVYNETDRWMCLFAIEALGLLDDIRAIEVFIDATEDESRDVRTKAIVTLGEMSSYLATDALYYLYAEVENDSEEQQTALFELGKRGDERALDGLIQVLQFDPQVDNRIYAALVLAEIGGEEAVTCLIDSLCDDVPDVADHALKSLVKLGSQSAAPLLQDLQSSSDTERRMWVIRALGEIGSEQAISALAALSDSPDEIWWLREEARSILQKLGHNSGTTQ